MNEVVVIKLGDKELRGRLIKFKIVNVIPSYRGSPYGSKKAGARVIVYGLPEDLIGKNVKALIFLEEESQGKL